ncbi:hypothetical protein Hypma_001757 [Hypsizygus marmoreus]|uniref:F-box domain-containing protein n=1 Tax=Hypsizygus marmoreus TaxID=39966 RepID=A0A369JCH1_HYPMA|nr:hypothetical protein Hypma_001757 [Hypsizygus marmoreus]
MTTTPNAPRASIPMQMDEHRPSAMHRCLTIPYLLTIMFEHAIMIMQTQKRWPMEGSSTLAALAVTCQVFKEPALKILWRFLPSLEPLVRCLPPHAICAHKSGSAPLHLSRKLRKKDFERVAYYGRMVRVLGYDCPIPDPFCPKADFDSLVVPLLFTRGRSSQHLLPNLRHLNIGIDEFYHQAVYPRLVIGPNLQSVDITVYCAWDDKPIYDYPWDNIRKTLMQSSPPSAPLALTSFRIVAVMRESQISEGPHPDLLDLICRLQRLKVLSTPYIAFTNESFSRLASFLDLVELNVTITRDEITQYLSHRPHGTPFPALKRLSIRTDDLDLGGRLLELPGFRNLDSLSILRSTQNSMWRLDTFFDGLKARSSVLNLSSFSISAPTEGMLPQAANISPVTPRTIQPLLSFANLANVTIGVDGVIEIDSDCLKRMAEAWPRLRSLTVDDRSQGTVPNITLTGLIPLAVSCPHLTDLCLRISALEDIPNFAQLGNVVPGNNLRWFNVSTSPIRNRKEVVIFLQLLFPNLDLVQPGWIYFEGDSDPLGPDDLLETQYLADWEYIQHMYYC